MNKKIFFVDIDGTIIDCENGLLKPTDKTKEAFSSIKNNGDLIFIASGRAKCLLPKEIIDLNPSGYILANGAYCELNNNILFEDVMNEDTINEIINFSNLHPSIYYLESDKKMYTKSLQNELHKQYIESWDLEHLCTDEVIDKSIKINIAMLALQNKEDIPFLYEKLNSYIEINAQGGSFASFDLNIKGVSKGYAIKRLIKTLNIDKENTFAFGDGINDIEMFQNVNNSVAMENAVNDLKMIANDITDSVLDDGLYNYLIKNHIIS